MDTNDSVKKARVEAVLKKAQQEERGKLTVFLGAAAGVGKTYAMLKAAHEKLAEGVDVVIGLSVSHERKETAVLEEGLPVVPQQKIVYRGHTLEEFDYAAVIKRHPQLVIIDELAHTNVPGSHFCYRYNDIEEILRAGIDVYTALNIQHLASMNDVVAKITGTVVRETVPDDFVAKADAVQLIDIPTEELQKRLREGKVYKPAEASRALKSFFRQGNISALRELALRYTAARVDEATTEYMRLHSISGPWPASGRVMVCAGYSPFAAQLILNGHRMAQGLHSELLVVNIETPHSRFPVGDKERERVWKNFKLTHDLGGKVLSVFGEDVVETILETARQNNVTAIVIGKSKRTSWRDYFRRTIVDRLIDRSDIIPVYVLKAATAEDEGSFVNTKKVPKKFLHWQQIGYSALMVAAVTLGMVGLSRYMELVNVALLYLLPVLISAMWWGRKASYITALLSILAFEFFFLAPTYTFKVDNLRYIWSFMIFFVAASVIGKRTESLKKEIFVTARRERDINSLYQFSKDVAVGDDMESIVKSFAEHVGKNMKRDLYIILPDKDKELKVKTAFDASEFVVKNNMKIADAEMVVANWCWHNGRIAGSSTDTLPTARNLFLPVLKEQTVLAVVAVDVENELLSPEERTLLEAWLGLLSVLLQKAQLAQQSKEIEILQESDKLRTALFNSVSHELKTPMAGIIGAIDTLQDKRIECTDAMRQELFNTISESSSRMERIIENLLDTARIASGMIKLKCDWCDLEEIIGGALRKWGASTKNYTITCDLPDDLPLFEGDGGLLEHVVLNYVDNAAKYSPEGSTILLRGRADKESVTLFVIDEGYGFQDEDQPHIFEKFYRAKCTDRVRGTGLGLAICKTIVEAHGGTVWAEHRQDKAGSVFAFKLPLKHKEGEEHDGK